jgi:hypothetical protein
MKIHKVFSSQDDFQQTIELNRTQTELSIEVKDGQSVSKSWCLAPSGAHDQIFITVSQLRPCFCGAPSLTRGRVCLFYMLLALASTVILGSETLETGDHILLSQIWDFHFRRLLRLAGSRWRYSTPTHTGCRLQVQVQVQVTLWLTVRQSVYRSSFKFMFLISLPSFLNILTSFAVINYTFCTYFIL